MMSRVDILFDTGLPKDRDARHTDAMTSRTSAARPVFPSSPFQTNATAPPLEKFAVDDMVTHDRHGVGRVVGVRGDNEVHVDFGSAVRRISLPNPKVTRL
ncbi:hypothetical protein CLV30_101478 [Haloactinopolyspora alba]|uniref:Uncharacterized protein n=1 Tax=Haloactinopolyspora alba TaxID=648780 RepID=A0A2P8EGA2_9ACTN|nr:hypothetical protein CLV30_101478 [Haloactinopolyspora alba]